MLQIFRRARSGRLTLSLLIPSLGALVACGGGDPSPAGAARSGAPGPGGPPGGGLEEAIPVEVAAVGRQDMSALYSTSSTLRASRRARVTTRSAGVIERLEVEEGDRVREGQVLARLEDDEQRIALERAESTRDTRERELARLQSLFEQELVSEDAFEKARRDSIDARHAADLARVELDRTRIVAPFDGIVLTRHLDVGNTVTAGTPVYDLADVTPLYTDVTVPERHVARLRAGQEVRLSPDAGAAAVAARIERIAPEVDASTGTVKVTLAVDEGAHLRPGSFVRVDITTDTRAQALVVPRGALVAEGRRWYVYRLPLDAEAVAKVEVEPGYEGTDAVEVRPLVEGALGEGDRVVVAGAGALEDGTRVAVATAAVGAESEAADGAADGEAGR